MMTHLVLSGKNNDEEKDRISAHEQVLSSWELSILQTKVIDSADTDTFSYLILLI